MKYLNKAIFCLIFSLVLLSSCVPLKDFVYLQGEPKEDELAIKKPETYRLQSGDNLYIQVISDDEMSYYNQGSSERYLTSDAAIEISSYKVDANGKVEVPNVGTFEVAGLSVEEVKEELIRSISKDLIKYSVSVKLVNRKISLLGEFNRPGTINFYKDQLTIFEAIGLGGDLTDLANRHKVKIIRKRLDGQEIATLDLTSNEVLNSDFYYILPNDIIYIEPSHKFYESKALSVTTTILSAFTTLFNLYIIIDRIAPSK